LRSIDTEKNKLTDYQQTCRVYDMSSSEKNFSYCSTHVKQGVLEVLCNQSMRVSGAHLRPIEFRYGLTNSVMLLGFTGGEGVK